MSQSWTGMHESDCRISGLVRSGPLYVVGVYVKVYKSV